MSSRTQIIATIGPASLDEAILASVIRAGADVLRLNLSWSSREQFATSVARMREVASSVGKPVRILADLAGPRIQEGATHTYDTHTQSCVTPEDEMFIGWGIENGVDYFGLSFVGGAHDVVRCREIIKAHGGTQRIVAKIERASALADIDAIIAHADAVMIARGDLGNEVALEEVPFVQATIIKKCRDAHTPVITATQMMLSMTEHPTPTRAEVTDVAHAIILGSDAVMLSEETASGKYPVEAVAMMECIAVAAERHIGTVSHTFL